MASPQLPVGTGRADPPLQGRKPGSRVPFPSPHSLFPLHSERGPEQPPILPLAALRSPENAETPLESTHRNCRRAVLCVRRRSRIQSHHQCDQWLLRAGHAFPPACYDLPPFREPVSPPLRGIRDFCPRRRAAFETPGRHPPNVQATGRHPSDGSRGWQVGARVIADRRGSGAAGGGGAGDTALAPARAGSI